MHHKVFEPSNDLKEFVKCYWVLESSKENTPKINTIIPDGTMKLIFHYGDLYWHHPKNGESFLQPRCFLIGQLTRPYIVEPKGDTGTFVVRFHPNGFLPFTSLPIKNMENRPIAIDQLFGNEGLVLEYNILNATNTKHRVKIIETYLKKLLEGKELKDRVVKSVLETILRTNGQTSIGALSEQNNLNRRVLSRKFSSNIGLSPKQISKIIRLQETLKILLNNEPTTLTAIAYESEYFDQAHFIKDFKEFTGLTPKAFYGDQLKMSMIFDKKS